MDRVNERCAGIDIHKDSLVVCVRIDGRELPVRSFGATTSQILALGDWLAELDVGVAAMEATGVYWRPIWNLLEDRLSLMLVNARHIKQVPGRKTDVCDAQWIARLLESGLLRASFIPARPQRELRDLTRQRTQLLRDRGRVINRIGKTLESANIKIVGLVSDLWGASGRRLLEALAEGKLSPAQMADLVDKRMDHKKPALREALGGRMNDHHRFMLRQLTAQARHIDTHIDAFDLRIVEVMSPLEKEALRRLDETPGFDLRSAQNLIAEIGTDMSRFPSAAHLASWAGLCPGNHQSGGKRKNAHVRKADVWLKATLTQAAWGASHTRNSYFAKRYHALKKRRGGKRAIVAIAHDLLDVAYHLLKHPEVIYSDPQPPTPRPASQNRQVQSLLRRLKSLGVEAHITETAA